jgi:hypothetical protein
MTKKASLLPLLVLLAWTFAAGTATAEPWTLADRSDPTTLCTSPAADPAPVLELGLLSQGAERSTRCSVHCQSDPKIKCSSEVGDCQYYAGGLIDRISCDGVLYDCPFPG